MPLCIAHLQGASGEGDDELREHCLQVGWVGMCMQRILCGGACAVHVCVLKLSCPHACCPPALQCRHWRALCSDALGKRAGSWGRSCRSASTS